MALITKPFTFTAGTTILSGEVNSCLDTIYSDYNSNITNANIASGAAIADTKFAQITTASKVSGSALVSLGSIPQQASTTENAFLIDSDTLTTGSLAVFDSNSADTGTRTLVKIINDNTLATGATVFSLQQDAAQNSMVVTHTAATGVALTLTASQTTANVQAITANALTTGIGLSIASSATAITGAGRMFYSNHSGNAGTTAILNEFASAAADETVIVKITASAALATGTALQVSGTAITTGFGITANDLNALTTGIGLHLATSATAITGAGRILYSNHTGNAGVSAILNEFASAAADETVVLRVTASAALAAGVLLDVTGAAVTTGTLIDCSNADALTSGFLANLVSNSSSNTARTLVQITNDNTSADNAKCLALQQDGDHAALYVDYNGTASDLITGIHIDGCDVANATGTVTISNVAPAGVGTATISGWLVFKLNGAANNSYIPFWS